MNPRRAVVSRQDAWDDKKQRVVWFEMLTCGHSNYAVKTRPAKTRVCKVCQTIFDRT